MKDFDGVILLIFGVAVSFALFLGFVNAIKKVYKGTSPRFNAVDSSKRHNDLKDNIRQIKARQKEMMRTQKQRIRDMRDSQKQKLRDLKRR